jgi:hypothetical protein
VVARLEHCEDSAARAFYKRLTRSFRLILFDKRGRGLSDHGRSSPHRRRGDAGVLRQSCWNTDLRRSTQARRIDAVRQLDACGASPAVAYALNRALLETDLRDCCRTYSIREGTSATGKLRRIALGEPGQLLHNALSLAVVRPGASFVASASNARTR